MRIRATWLVLLACIPLAAQNETRVELTAAFATKVLASAVFVSERTPEEAIQNSVLPLIATWGYKPKDIHSYQLDRDAKRIRLTLDGVTREAVFYGGQGCILSLAGEEALAFAPEEIAPKIPDPTITAWPMGDLVPENLSPDIDHQKLHAALDQIFAEGAFTAACVIVHSGQIIAERYGSGAHRDMRLESWSMGKSLTAMLYGRLLQRQGEDFDPDLPAPISAWEDGDPRQKITIGNLLQMSSGLRFSHTQDSQDLWDHGFPDHFYVYGGAIDAFAFVASRPQEHAPGTVGRYRNCDPLLIGSIVKQRLEPLGESYLTFPQRELFDPLGIDGIVLEPDPYGNFVSTGYEYGTGRDWARLGMLALQDGIWQEQRLLPEGFIDFVSTPAPAWKNKAYGGLFWVNGNRRWQLPEDAYYMAGHGGQNVIMVPSHDLVIVRMGHQRGGIPGAQALNRALPMILGAVVKVR